jgi:hypothetical protein
MWCPVRMFGRRKCSARPFSGWGLMWLVTVLDSSASSRPPIRARARSCHAGHASSEAPRPFSIRRHRLMPLASVQRSEENCSQMSSRGGTRPWCIESVYLFDAKQVLTALSVRGVRTGIASSVRNTQWDAAEIYPRLNNPLITVEPKQAALLGLCRTLDSASRWRHSVWLLPNPFVTGNCPISAFRFTGRPQHSGCLQAIQPRHHDVHDHRVRTSCGQPGEGLKHRPRPRSPRSRCLPGIASMSRGPLDHHRRRGCACPQACRTRSRSIAHVLLACRMLLRTDVPRLDSTY